MSAKPNQCHICKTILLSRVGLLKHLQTQHAAAEGSTTEEEMVEEDTEISDSESTVSENRVIEANVESPESESVDSAPPPPEVIEITSSSSDDALEAAAAESPEHYICGLCNNIFDSQSRLEDHLESVHGNGTPSPEEPEMRVRVSCSNKATEVAFNQPVRTYFCHVCDNFFNSQLNLNEHLKDFHKLNPFICIYCDGEFFLEDLLRNHEIQDHQDKTVYRCEICQKRFVTEAGLEQHRCILEEGRN